MARRVEDRWLSVRCSAPAREAIDRLAARLRPACGAISRTAILRRAVELGLEALEEDPRRLVGQP